MMNERGRYVGLDRPETPVPEPKRLSPGPVKCFCGMGPDGALLVTTVSDTLEGAADNLLDLLGVHWVMAANGGYSVAPVVVARRAA